MGNRQPIGGILGRVIGATMGVALAGFGGSFIMMALFGMGDAPFFFRVPFVLVPLVFVVIGCCMVFVSIFVKGPVKGLTDQFISDVSERDNKKADSVSSESINLYAYQCNHCGATLGDGADVSPRGDVKCAFCKQWFNINQSR